jgi:hypothetical protein
MGCSTSGNADAVEERIMNDNYLGLPVARILDDYHLDKSDMILMDEPPGNLVAITFKRFGKGRDRKEVTVWLQGSPRLFDQERSWSLETIRQATVAHIEIK